MVIMPFDLLFVPPPKIPASTCRTTGIFAGHYAGVFDRDAKLRYVAVD